MNMKKKAGMLFIVLCFTMLFSMTCFAGKYTGEKHGGGKIKMILVGDSRTMHMSQRNADHTKNIYFVYGNGCSAKDLRDNYDGFKTRVKNALKKYDNTIVVFMLGVNGNSNPASNIVRLTEAYDFFMDRYKNHTYVVSTVGKTFGCKDGYANAKVKDLNARIVPTFGWRVSIFPLYDWTANWVSRKSETADGLHYKGGTYNKILNKLKDTYGIPR